MFPPVWLACLTFNAEFCEVGVAGLLEAVTDERTHKEHDARGCEERPT
jgi:hypothetical protein